MNSQLNTACFRQFAVLLVLVSQFQTISSDWFANINADFILPSLHCPSASTEFASNPLIVKPLQHAIQSNRDQQKCLIPTLQACTCTQGPRMIFLIVFIIWSFFHLIFFSFSLTENLILLEMTDSAVAQRSGGRGEGAAAAEPPEPYAHGKLSHSI